MAANTINEAILKAIEIVVDKNIQEAPTDRTITATIVGCINAMSNEYRVDFQGGSFTALAKEGETYRTNQSVYVLVPEGDFSKTKRIIGLASLTKEDYNLTSVNSTINNYFTVGKNAITNKNKEESFGVCSFYPVHWEVLYDHSDSTKNQVIIDEVDLKNSLNEAEGILLKGSFSTTLPFEHKKANGSYGLLCVVAYEGETENEYNLNLYDLNSSKMLGNPLSYPSFVSQQLIFEHEANQKFSHIEKIVFYCQDFVEEKKDMQNNIFLKDLELFALKKIGATNGEYDLTLSTPNGITFKKNDLETSFLPIVAALKKKESKLDIGVQYYWFVEDARVIDSKHSEYNTYAGVGWRKLDNLAAKSSINIPKRICSAYKTKFLCVVVAYDTITLKTEFSLYNDAHNMNITIELDSKTNTFAYNTGKPTLTCKVLTQEGDNLDPSGENLYYLWSKIQQDKNEIIFNKTAEEIQEEIAELEETDLFTKAALETQLSYLKGVEFNSNNSISYPISKIDIAETLKCTVYSKKQNGMLYGSAEVLLKNGVDVNKNDYYIVIKNGEQVFQYSESGVSPTSERVQEPLEILPLEATFYAPDGTEIKNSGINSYSVSWQFPAADNTLLESIGELDLNRIIETEVCSFKIKDEYNSQVDDNQIHCIIEYKGLKITGSTNFFFTKIGEDGTNGTDIVAKIEPENNSSLATVFLDVNNNFYSLEENSGSLQGGSLGVKLRLFQRAQEIKDISSSWKWSTAKTTTLNILAVDSEGKITVNDVDNQEQELKDIVLNSYLVLQGSCSYNSGTYYAHYPIPVIKNYFINYDKNNTDLQKVNLTDFYVTEISKKSLRSVLYNKDGKDPVYNNKIGVTVNCSTSFNNSWSVSANTSGEALEEQCQVVLSEEKNSFIIFVSPKESYSGSKNNNLIYFKISNSTGKVAAEGWIPIHFSLNTYGLASLNAWDGNHIDINEDGAYIMAPQMGAGVKNNKNQFTGIVMGKAQFGDEQENIGLFGLKDGRQSIFLDAKTGAATFGLNDEDYEDISNSQKGQNCGRIHLDPEGESYISSWRIGRKSLYSVNGQVSESLTPLEDAQDHHPRTAIGSIPRDKQGIILSSDPAFISVKGAPAVDEIKIRPIKDDESILYCGDSYEVLLDSNNVQGSVFSILEHTTEPEDVENYIIQNDSQNNLNLYKQTGENLNNIGIFAFTKEPIETIDSNERKVYITFTFNSSGFNVFPVPLEVNYNQEEGYSYVWKILEVNSNFSKNEQLKYIVVNDVLSEYQYLDAQKKQKEFEFEYKWKTVETAGLDEEGNLNANTVGRDKARLKIGYVPAFNSSIRDKKYIGLNLGYKEDSFFKSFIETKSGENNDTLYLTASEKDDDCGRNLSFYAKEFHYSTKPINEVSTKDWMSGKFSHDKISLGSFSAKEESLLEDSSIEEFLSNLSGNDQYVIIKDEDPSPVAINNNLYYEDGNGSYFNIQKENIKKRSIYDLLESSLFSVYPLYEKIDGQYYLKYLNENYKEKVEEQKDVDTESYQEWVGYLEGTRLDSVLSIDDPFFFPVLSLKQIYFSSAELIKGKDWFTYGDKVFNQTSSPIPPKAQIKEGHGSDYSNLELLVYKNYVFNPERNEEGEIFSPEEWLWFEPTSESYKLIEDENLFVTNGSNYYPIKSITIKKKKDVEELAAAKDLLSLNSSTESENYLKTKNSLNLITQSDFKLNSTPFNLIGSKDNYSVSLSTKIVNNTDYWNFTLSSITDQNLSKEKYSVQLCNNRKYEGKEGLFFPATPEKTRRAALYSYKGLHIQDVSCDLKKNNIRKSRRSLQNSKYSLNIQSIGNYSSGAGISIQAIPSTFSFSQTAELNLRASKDGVQSNFELRSPAGDIYSSFGKFSRVSDGTLTNQRQIIINAPLRLRGKGSNNTVFYPLHCGNIVTHGKAITTGTRTSNYGDTTRNKNDNDNKIYGKSFTNKVTYENRADSSKDKVLGSKGGEIYTRGGYIHTNGGEIYTRGGSINLGTGKLTVGGVIQGVGYGIHFGGTIWAHSSLKVKENITANGTVKATKITATGSIEASGSVTATDFLL